MNNLNLAVHFILQLVVILMFCRLVGAIAARFGQPQVVAEMIAGVLLGPSSLGLLWPEGQQWLFSWDTSQKARDTQSYLFPASQLGLALYMFVVGIEFRVDIVRRRLKSSISVSVAGMLGTDGMRTDVWYPEGWRPHFSVLVTMEENKARIGPMIVREDGASSVQLVHQWGRNLALFDGVGSGDRPVGIVSHRVACREFLKGFLLGIRRLLPTLRQRKCCLTCCEWHELVG